MATFGTGAEDRPHSGVPCTHTGPLAYKPHMLTLKFISKRARVKIEDNRKNADVSQFLCGRLLLR